MNPRLILKALWLVLILIPPTACNHRRGNKRKALFQLGSVPKITTFVSGSKSQIRAPGAYLIQSKKQWDDLLARHIPKGGMAIQHFDVDFNDYSVLAVFAGDGVNQASYSELTFKRIDDGVRARLTLDSIESGPTAFKSSVYAFAIIEKTDDMILVEVGSLEGLPLKKLNWREVPVKTPKD